MKIFSKKKYELGTGKVRAWCTHANGREVKNGAVDTGSGYTFPVNEWCVDSAPLMERFKNEKIAVRFTEKWQCDTFLKMCEEAGVTWCSGHRATEKPSYDYGATNTCYSYVAGRHCGVGFASTIYHTENGYKVIDYLDFIDLAVDELKEEPKNGANEKYKIFIVSDGKTTTAEFMVNGKTVKTATASCHPADRFNIKTGAELAFERLWERERKAKKLDLHNLKPGDRVRVRKDLCPKMYGRWDAAIKMCELAGKTVTIKKTCGDDADTVFYRIDEYECFWSPEMFEEDTPCD